MLFFEQNIVTLYPCKPSHSNMPWRVFARHRKVGVYKSRPHIRKLKDYPRHFPMSGAPREPSGITLFVHFFPFCSF